MLKRIIPFALAALTLVACQGKQTKMTLTGTAPEEADGAYVYVVDMEKREAIDSVKIENGKFTLTMDVEEPVLRALASDHGFFSFIAEAGNLTTELKGDEGGSVKGSVLNNDLSAILEKGYEITDEFARQMEALMEDSTLSNEERGARRAEIEPAMFAKYKTVFNEYFPKHKNDPVGIYLLLVNFSDVLSKEEFDAALESAGPVVKESPMVLSVVEERASIEKTAVGSMFTDFSGINPNDTAQTVSFSQFVGKGNYVIADFWASWCGPCKAEMPTLAKIYKEYHPKGLEIVGVVVSDKLDAHHKSVEELKVVWPQIFDAENNGGKAYAVTGIPHIIIFDGEGKIVAKDVRGEELEKLIAGFYAK